MVVAANAKASDGYSPVLYLLGKESVEAEWPEVSGAVASGAPGEPLADETAAGAGRIYKVSVRIGN